MSKILFLLAFLFGFISFADSAKPFHRVLVLGGGGLQTAIYLGIIEGLEKNGWKPDLIISTCGSSIAAAVLNGEGHIQDASNYIFSNDYYALLKEVRIENSFALPIAGRIFNNDFIGFYPQVYDKSILNVPFELKSTYKDRAMEKYFTSSAQGAIPIIIIAAKAGFGPNQVGDKILNKKFITETFFTDADTAEKIPKRFTSPLAQNFPESFVLSGISIKTDVNLYTAARASISDPYLISPMKINGDYYLTGGVDLYPIELAEQIADEVIITYGSPYGKIEERAIENVFSYNPNKRLKSVMEHSVFHWIDLSDDGQYEKQIGFEPQSSTLFWLKSSVPKEASQFNDKVSSQWSLGFNRAKEALNSGVNSKSHISNKSW